MRIPRSSGILLHPTSLPGSYGVGDLGPTSRWFVDRLAGAGQRWWQILPLNPPDYGGSPYSSISAFATNPTLVDLHVLEQWGWLEHEELADLEREVSGARADRFEVEPVMRAHERALRRAFTRWQEEPDRDLFEEYCERESYWLEDFALFAALKASYGGRAWYDWDEELVRRDPGALERARITLAEDVLFEQFKQWLFDNQWHALREYARVRDVHIIGDIPIFVAMDSADVWSHREIFKVDESGKASVVAGVPPDYFSETGQKWGNPVFAWDVLEENDYEWWMQRIQRTFELVDLVRIDHFRGFQAYWEVPAEAPNAIEGEWVDGPGEAFFEAVRARFSDCPFIAEDLGMITDDVLELRDSQDLPGMKVIQFAFDGNADHPFLPHTYPENCVAYTGTHDNDTTQGWYDSEDEQTRHRVREYVQHGDDGIVWALIESLLASDADLVVTPAQDLYELGTEARMNHPGTSEGNWRWRMTNDQLGDDAVWARLAELTRDSDRC